MIIAFGEFSESQISQAGGKGASLVQMATAGFPVPDGFVITVDCFDANGLRAEYAEQAKSQFTRLRADGPVAVRSSALAEDSDVASFAGGFESVLNVATVDEFSLAVQEVYDSASSERIASYSRELGTEEDHRIAIVVQKMVAAEFSGVLFTVDPVTQNRTALTGNFISGLGDQLVSGEVSAEAFTINRETGEYDGSASLDRYAGRLSELALGVEQHFGSPQDIEWAVCEGEVHILQSRPITTLSDHEIWNSSLGRNCLWTNTNVGEALGGVMTPYTWSLIRQTFDTFYEPPPPYNMLGNIGGRVYLDLSLLLGLVGKFGLKPRTALSFVSSGLGEVPEEMSTPVSPVGFGQSLRCLMKTLGKAVVAAVGQKRYIRWAENESSAECDQKLRDIEAIRTPQEAIDQGEQYRTLGDHHFQMLIRVTNDFMIKRELFKAQLARHLADDDVETLVSGLGGDSVLQSMGPMVAIEKVARGELSREEFVRSYGHRGPDEVELSKPRTSEDPEWIDKLIDQARDVDIWKLLDRQQSVREEAWQRLADKVRPGRYRRLRRMAQASALAAQHREVVRSELVRFMMIPRQLACRIGELTGLGEDIFFLEFDEIFELLSGDESLREVIPGRKTAYERYLKVPPLPNFISGTIDPETWADNPARRTDYFDANHHLSIDDGSVVTGFPGAAGIVEGRVRVLLDHNEGDQLRNGEILVASFTNVGWTPIFPRAAAVVTDIGAPLSHAAIVARELGIPAVVGAGNATMALKTGDTVRVNGGAGVVEILTRDEEKTS